MHKARPFFNDLCTFMTSGPVVIQVLEGEGAVAKNRDIMGATNPANAAAGTIRKDFAELIEANSVHGSDSPENAAIEIGYFFAGSEIVGEPATSKKRPDEGPLLALGMSTGQPRTAKAIRSATVPPMPSTRAKKPELPTRPNAMQESSSTMNRIENSTSLLNDW